MVKKKWIFPLVYLVLLTSAALFFVYPHHAYISKLMYLALITGLGVWHFIQRNTKSVAACLFGLVFLAATLPGNRIVTNILIVVILVAWGITTIVMKRAREDDDLPSPGE